MIDLLLVLIFSKPTRADAGTSFPNNVCFTVLAARPHALRPCARQPRGCHFNWLWPCVVLRASTPQLSAQPRPRPRGPSGSMGDRWGGERVVGGVLPRISVGTWGLCARLCRVLVCGGRYGVGEGFFSSSWASLGGVGPVRGLRGGGRGGWREEWARSG